LVHDRPIVVVVVIAATLMTGPGTTVLSRNQPETSATSWTVPGESLSRATMPLAPTGAITRFGTV
jgi:hypothetical protein